MQKLQAPGSHSLHAARQISFGTGYPGPRLATWHRIADYWHDVCTGLLEHALVTEASSQLHVAALGLLLHLSTLFRPVFLEHCAARVPRIVQLTSHTNAEGMHGVA